MATKESTPSPDKKPSPGLTPVDESLARGPDQGIAQLPSVEDSDKGKDENETIHQISRVKTFEVPAKEPALIEQGHHSESTSPAEKSLSSASFDKSTSLYAKRKPGHKLSLNLPKFLKTGEKKSRTPSPSPQSPKSSARYSSLINLATVTEQDGLPYEVDSCSY